MALQINWTVKALDHLDNILNYWEERNGTRTYSNKLHVIFQEALEVLSRYPDSGRQTNNLFLKKKSVKDYFIYYAYNHDGDHFHDHDHHHIHLQFIIHSL